MTDTAFDLTQTPELWYTRLLTLDPAYVRERVAAFLAEDMPDGDATTLSTIDPHTRSVAEVRAAQELVFAGASFLPLMFSEHSQVEVLVADGTQVNSGTVLARVSGLAQELLARERVMLNLLQRLCGVATQTRRYTSMSAPPGFKLLDTRKTTPGLRLFEKYAVSVGGGYNHRYNLSDVIMIKDNHLVAAGGVRQALERVRQHNQTLSVELEVDNLEQLREALDVGGFQAFLLDNMSPATIREAVALVRAYPGGDQIFLEASGGITDQTLPEYLWSGVNGISVGALTTQARNVDIKLEFVDSTH